MKSRFLPVLSAALLLAGVSTSASGQTPSPISVPESSSLLLLGSGLGLMAFTIRRWRKKRQ